ncbi:MAG: polyprenol monophosphomannose synthase [Patescibacteria group bacterium]
MYKISIILPTYDERENIIDLILAIDKYVKEDKEIIVVDDNSPDGTSQIVQNFIAQKKIANLKLITRTKNKGLTNSIWEGIQNAQGKIIVWMDCDFSMPPELIPKLIEKIDKGYDISVGSRFVKGGSFKKDTKGSGDSWLAVILSRLMNVFIWIALDGSFKDYTSGFIAIKKEVFKKIKLQGDYGEYFMDLIFRAILFNYKIIEIPYVCLPRAKGYSKTGQNLIDYIKRGTKYIIVALRLFIFKIKYKLFKIT